MEQTLPCILASASPRRKEIISMLGIRYTVDSSDIEEHTDQTEPAEIVKDLARQKASAVANRHRNEQCFILGSDTVVSIDGMILGKPKNREEAVSMLRRLSGRTNTVYTGVCILIQNGNRTESVVFCDSAEVSFMTMSDREIEWYVDELQPYDKAGAYAVQGPGARFISEVRGDFYTVMGLPVNELYKKLKESGLLFV